MDSLTHIALGACIGEVFFGKQIGKKAMIWGALAQSLPDIDFIAGFWMPVAEELLAHRGFTHSFLFIFLATPALAFAADRIHRPHEIMFRRFLLFFAAEMLVHIFLDGFNNYGTGWFEPFSHARFSFNAVYVADPLFSIWPAIATVVLAIIPNSNKKRSFWIRFGLIPPAMYLLLSVFNKLVINNEVKKIVKAQKIPMNNYFITPTPLNNLLWYVVTGNDSGYYVGYRSVFDKDTTMDFQYFPRNDSLLRPISEHEDVHQLIRFAQGFYTVERWGDSIVFNDLRFGQIIGWQSPEERFVFHYFLQHPGENMLVVQRGRFAKWDKDVAIALLRRMAGRKKALRRL